MGSNQDSRIRFRKADELVNYLENIEDRDFIFRAVPISGEPETFSYDSREKLVARQEEQGGDKKVFESLDDFACYAFQCDAEGYPHTEYVDVEIIK